MKKKRYYVLLPNYGHSKERANQDRYAPRQESFHQFTRRTSAGIPLTSEDVEIYKKEESARIERRIRLFWDSFPVIMRSWKKILKYPALSNIPLDSIGLVSCFSGITLGALVFAWRASCMRCECPQCHGEAYVIPFYIRPIFDGAFTDFPDACPIYCSSCGEEDDLYDHEYDPRSKSDSFHFLLECWKRCCHPTYSNLLYEQALHLLRLSEVYGEDIEEFGEPFTAIAGPKRKFSDADATGEELIALLREDEPYQLEGASRETLLGIIHNYERIMGYDPEAATYTICDFEMPIDASYDFEKPIDEDVLNERAKEMEELRPENLPDESLKKKIKYYEDLLR